MRFLHLIRPVMCVLPEVASPDRKVSNFEIIVETIYFQRGFYAWRVKSSSCLLGDQLQLKSMKGCMIS